MNIYESIAAVMSDIGAVGKNSKNAQQGFMFRGIDAVMNALAPALVKNKVFMVPEILEQSREERTSVKKDSYGNEKTSYLIYSICKIKYTFYAYDGSSRSATGIGEGMDTGDCTRRVQVFGQTVEKISSDFSGCLGVACSPLPLFEQVHCLFQSAL